MLSIATEALIIAQLPAIFIFIVTTMFLGFAYELATKGKVK